MIGATIALTRTPGGTLPSNTIAVTLAIEPSPATEPQPPATSSPAPELPPQGEDASPPETPPPNVARSEDVSAPLMSEPRSEVQDTPSTPRQLLPAPDNRVPPPARVSPKTRKPPSAVSTGPVVPAPAAGQLQPGPQSIVVPNQQALVPLIPPRAASGLASNRKPNYPMEARSRRQQGRVLLRVQVSAAGTATAVDVVSSSGHPMLDQAARAAVQTWHFIPATRAGAAVPAQVEVPIEFRMGD
jgi:protein TonB